MGASQFCLKGEFTPLAPPDLVGKGVGGLGLLDKLRCSPARLIQSTILQATNFAINADADFEGLIEQSPIFGGFVANF